MCGIGSPVRTARLRCARSPIKDVGGQSERTAASNAWRQGTSAACPPVSRTPRASLVASDTKWILQAKPPCERPRAGSCGSSASLHFDRQRQSGWHECWCRRHTRRLSRSAPAHPGASAPATGRTGGCTTSAREVADGLPRPPARLGRHARAIGAQRPEQPIDDVAVIAPPTTTAALRRRHLGDHRPLDVGQLMTAPHDRSCRRRAPLQQILGRPSARHCLKGGPARP